MLFGRSLVSNTCIDESKRRQRIQPLLKVQRISEALNHCFNPVDHNHCEAFDPSEEILSHWTRLFGGIGFKRVLSAKSGVMKIASKLSLVLVFSSLLGCGPTVATQPPQPAFDWSVRDAASASLVAREIQRERAPNGTTTVRYFFDGKGFADGPDYTLFLRDALGRVRQVTGLVFQDGALGLGASDTGEWIRFQYSLGNMASGEPSGVGVRSKDGRTSAHTTLVPHPLEARGDGGCSVSALRVGSGFVVTHAGHQEGAKVSVSLSVGDWERALDFVAVKGRTGEIIEPSDSGKTGGKAILRARSEGCRVELELPFGNAVRPL